MMNADSLISDKVICRGIVNPEDAASGMGDVKEGFENRYVLRGFAYIVDILAFCLYNDRDNVGKLHARIHCTKLFSMQ